jgi:hypothetical protein
MSQRIPSEGDIRVWYIPQVPMSAYEVDVPSRKLSEAVRIQDAIIGLSIFEYKNRVKPDYADAAGIVRYESDGEGGFEWYELDEEEIAELIAAEEVSA